ncbi:hypothetical protein EVAR_25894_1 [Eumeta japonica]|uniref:Uncharacterized protein n=1 Tax=Eumeta variegata TaxID=151549 RepID=A0A4C1W3W9_EUMVA|nr:hypothetical protein EVAR_25894_1 [Eumeta japonica]
MGGCSHRSSGERTHACAAARRLLQPSIHRRCELWQLGVGGREVGIGGSSPPAAVDDRLAPEADPSRALFPLLRFFRMCYVGFFGPTVGCC